jgi:transcriptional regulator with GAF, ATPase, and Fis domain
VPEEASVLLRIAALNESKKDWTAALDCLERALKVSDPGSRERIAELAARIESRASLSSVRDRAKSLAKSARGGSSRVKSAPAEEVPPVPDVPPAPDVPAPRTPSPGEIERAREILITPDVVRALRDALAIAQKPPKAAAPGEIVLPVETMLARLLACELDLSPMVDLALDLVLEATGAARGFMLARDEKGRLELCRGRGLGRAEIPAALSTSILAEAERTGEPVFVEDATQDPRFLSRESVQGLGLRSVACVPILDEPPAGTGELLGVVYLDDPRSKERFAGEKTKALLCALARAIAPQLRNARRFEAQRAALARARKDAQEKAPGSASRIVGRSKAIKELLDLVARVAPEDVPALIEGESGTGKELTARVIHDLSPRAKGPFVAENLGALPTTLIEAELFGVVKGAFTGADRDRDGLFVRAQGGTVFLDEVGELPLEGQSKLLRVLQEREVRPLGSEKVVRVDVRVVAATNKDLLALVRAGKFREDLLYRLRVVAVPVPPLRERLEDIPLLCEHVLERIALERGEPVSPLSRAALAKLAQRPWPGNVRELENVLWRVALAGEGVLDGPSSDLAMVAMGSRPEDPLGLEIQLPGPTVGLEDARTLFDRSYLSLVLARNGGNVARAARDLAVTRPALSRLLKRLGIERGEV